MPSNVQNDADKVKEDIAKLKEDIAQLTQSLKGVAAARGAEGVDTLKRTAHQTRDQAKAFSQDLERQVADRPLTSMLVAFGVGFVIGRLLDRR